MVNGQHPQSGSGDEGSAPAKELKTLPKWHPYNVAARWRNKAAAKGSQEK
jgi:hypothetical protein